MLFTIEKENLSRPPFSLANPAPPVSILSRAVSLVTRGVRCRSTDILILCLLQERAVEYFSPAPLPKDDDRAKMVVEKTISVTRRPAADQLGFESDQFAEALESRKRRVVNPPAAATGS